MCFCLRLHLASEGRALLVKHRGMVLNQLVITSFAYWYFLQFLCWSSSAKESKRSGAEIITTHTDLAVNGVSPGYTQWGKCAQYLSWILILLFNNEPHHFSGVSALKEVSPAFCFLIETHSGKRCEISFNVGLSNLININWRVLCEKWFTSNTHTSPFPKFLRKLTLMGKWSNISEEVFKNSNRSKTLRHCWSPDNVEFTFKYLFDKNNLIGVKLNDGNKIHNEKPKISLLFCWILSTRYLSP